MARLLSLRPEPDDVRIARAFCTAELGAVLARSAVPEAVAEELLDTGAVVTSELVTNALRAGAGHIHLRVEQVCRRFRIAVLDDAVGDVVPETPGPLAVSGRGLQIVAAVAADWGVLPGPDGKQVWAELELPVPAEDGRALSGDDQQLTDAAVG